MTATAVAPLVARAGKPYLRLVVPWVSAPARLAQCLPPMPQHSPGLTDSQRAAREAFDLDAAMAALPTYRATGATESGKGQAGVRMRAHLVADISDDLLREFAQDELGAKRCSEQYLDALRVVLGNQADAERHGYLLEMNQRVSFAPPNVMRTIIRQMQAAGITFGSVVGLGEGRSQVVQCFVSRERNDSSSADQLMQMERKTEAEDLARWDAAQLASQAQRANPESHDAGSADAPAYPMGAPPAFISEEDAPY